MYKVGEIEETKTSRGGFPGDASPGLRPVACSLGPAVEACGVCLGLRWGPEVPFFVMGQIQLHRGWLRGSELLMLVIMMRCFSLGRAELNV